MSLLLGYSLLSQKKVLASLKLWFLDPLKIFLIVWFHIPIYSQWGFLDVLEIMISCFSRNMISQFTRNFYFSFHSKFWILDSLEIMIFQLTRNYSFSIHSKSWYLVLLKIMISRFTQNYDISNYVNDLFLFHSE